MSLDLETMTVEVPLKYIKPCPECEYDEATGDLYDHCPKCCHTLMTVAYAAAMEKYNKGKSHV